MGSKRFAADWYLRLLGSGLVPQMIASATSEREIDAFNHCKSAYVDECISHVLHTQYHQRPDYTIH